MQTAAVSNDVRAIWTAKTNVTNLFIYLKQLILAVFTPTICHTGLCVCDTDREKD